MDNVTGMTVMGGSYVYRIDVVTYSPQAASYGGRRVILDGLVRGGTTEWNGYSGDCEIRRAPKS